MAEAFLEEQLKRIRQMTEQMSRVRRQAYETSAEIQRQRDSQRSDPLQQVRDFRTYSSSEAPRHERADDHASRGRRRQPRKSAHRR